MGLPKLGASLRRTVRGITVSKTLSGRCCFTSSTTCLARLVRPVEHRHHHAAELEGVVEVGGFQALDVAEDLPEALEGEVLALQGDEQVVGGGEAVHREQAEGGRAVDDDGAVAVGLADGSRTPRSWAR
jgi:hypothetical protein